MNHPSLRPPVSVNSFSLVLSLSRPEDRQIPAGTPAPCEMNPSCRAAPELVAWPFVRARTVSLFELPVRRPVATAMFFVAVLILGAIAWQRIAVELLPPVKQLITSPLLMILRTPT